LLSLASLGPVTPGAHAPTTFVSSLDKKKKINYIHPTPAGLIRVLFL